MESAYELESGGLSHETQADLGLCSMVVLVVVPCEAQRALVTKPLVEKTVTQLRLPVCRRPRGGEFRQSEPTSWLRYGLCAGPWKLRCRPNLSPPRWSGCRFVAIRK